MSNSSLVIGSGSSDSIPNLGSESKNFFAYVRKFYDMYNSELIILNSETPDYEMPKRLKILMSGAVEICQIILNPGSYTVNVDLGTHAISGTNLSKNDEDDDETNNDLLKKLTTEINNSRNKYRLIVSESTTNQTLGEDLKVRELVVQLNEVAAKLIGELFGRDEIKYDPITVKDYSDLFQHLNTTPVCSAFIPFDSSLIDSDEINKERKIGLKHILAIGSCDNCCHLSTDHTPCSKFSKMDHYECKNCKLSKSLHKTCSAFIISKSYDNKIGDIPTCEECGMTINDHEEKAEKNGVVCCDTFYSFECSDDICMLCTRSKDDHMISPIIKTINRDKRKNLLIKIQIMGLFQDSDEKLSVTEQSKDEDIMSFYKKITEEFLWNKKICKLRSENHDQ